MPQTLLSLLALVLASLMTFNQQRVSTASYEEMVRNEFELAASGMLMHVMELVGSRSFDERSTPDGIRLAGRLPEGPLSFALPSAFGAADRGTDGCNLEYPFETPACDDIDDVHGVEWQTVMARLSDGRTLPFEVSAEVFYVTDANLRTPSETPTTHKRVILRARSPFQPERTEIARVERVFSFDPILAENHYEELHGPITE